MNRSPALAVAAAFALVAAAAPARSAVIDISGAFNADTFASNTSDSAGIAYRDELQKNRFLANATINSGSVTAGGYAFSLGPVLGSNTVLLQSSGAAGSVTIDIADQRLSEFSFVHSAVGFNIPSASKNGTITVNYLDGTTQNVFWDLRDSDGNNGDGQSQLAIGSLTNRQFSDNTSSPANRSLWYQTVTGLNAAKTVASITFSSANVGVAPNQDTDADFGVYAITGTASPFVTLDLSSKFNRDTIAVHNDEPIGGGYRGLSETFIATNHAGAGNSPNLPAASVGEIVASFGGKSVPFEFGPYDSPDTVQNNTWVLGLGETSSLDIADQTAHTASVLFTAVGYNTVAGEVNGTFTVTYTDASFDTFTWDLIDSANLNNSGLAHAALSGIDLWDSDTNALVASGINNRILWFQSFAVDPGKTIDTITFSTVGVIDGGGTDAQFGIYAVTLTIPEPASAALLAAGLLHLVRRRRRTH